jgi:hypothetical protein
MQTHCPYCLNPMKPYEALCPLSFSFTNDHSFRIFADNSFALYVYHSNAQISIYSDHPQATINLNNTLIDFPKPNNLSKSHLSSIIINIIKLSNF